MTSDVFTPPADQWLRISPRYATVKRITGAIGVLLVFVPGAVVAWLTLQQWWAPAAVGALGALLYGWLAWRAGRWVRAWGYAERDADLCITSGLLWRRLLVVPFGRLQLVEVSSGPLLRAFGLARVELVTASAQTDAALPGLPHADAVALRDRLIDASDATQAEGSGL